MGLEFIQTDTMVEGVKARENFDFWRWLQDFF
jgi:hypothetical protein